VGNIENPPLPFLFFKKGLRIMETKELKFKFEKETKNTVRYQEQGSTVINTLYIQKEAIGGTHPNEITVTIGEVS